MELGYASPRRMLQEVSRWELGIWAALYGINPWGEMRADQRAAIGHALLANVNRDPQKRPQPYQVRDFMPYMRQTPQERERELAAQIVAYFEGVAGKGGKAKAGKVKRKK